MPQHDRATELALIETFLTETGATVSPTHYAWGVRGAVPGAEERRRNRQCVNHTMIPGLEVDSRP
jgi:hypothetical protein